VTISLFTYFNPIASSNDFIVVLYLHITGDTAFISISTFPFKMGKVQLWLNLEESKRGSIQWVSDDPV
jgi:hypothetical protein